MDGEEGTIQSIRVRNNNTYLRRLWKRLLRSFTSSVWHMGSAIEMVTIMPNSIKFTFLTSTYKS